MKVFKYPIQVRFRDCDGLGHINNAVYHSYIESSRTCWLDETLQLGVFAKGKSIPIILARTEIDFLKQGHLHDKITVNNYLAHIGTKSFRQVYMIESDQGLLAKAEAVLVWFDFKSNASVAIPDEYRSLFQAFLHTDT